MTKVCGWKKCITKLRLGNKDKYCSAHEIEGNFKDDNFPTSYKTGKRRICISCNGKFLQHTIHGQKGNKKYCPQCLKGKRRKSELRSLLKNYYIKYNKNLPPSWTKEFIESLNDK